MPEDHRARADELVAGYRRSREQLKAVQAALAAVTATAASSDGSVTATVGPQGRLTELTFAADVYRTHRPRELAELIVELTARAAATVAARAEDVVAPVLPAGADPEAMLAGRADLRPAEITPPARHTREPVEDDGELGERSWLQATQPGRRR